ncbi:MAG: bifunctional folylpolyglutamate synthase/dihydrofolate synthase [candidate division WOR-3 bacterium]|nr:MAG: bifunctional folylpolyglutamate synthase/dihydrofolate synthase [candidate division WOR-3 bacterium]
MKYSEALSRLDSLVNYEKLAKPRNEFKLDDIRELLRLAGNPDGKLKRVVLVAGTKGKGSVCHMLEAALRACGRKTGMFVSPHVSTVRERIQVGGAPVSRRTFSRLVERIWPLVRRQPVSYFELTAALAFALFERESVDYALVEVGLGGRLDATNLLEPAVSVITRIGFDHTRVLGRTLPKIAREKSGIFRRGRPVVVGRQPPEAEQELRKRAAATGAEFVPAWTQVRVWDVRAVEGGTSCSVLGELGAGRLQLALLGGHQVENAQTALAVLGLLARHDDDVSMEGVLRGLGSVSIPARCELVSVRPPVVVDSCHNPESGAALARAIADHLGGTGRRRKAVLVYGSLKGKLIAQTVRPLARWTKTAVLVKPDSPRAADHGQLKLVFGRLHIPYVQAESVREGLQEAFAISAGLHPVVVAGSFYLAGEALEVLGRDSTR